MSRPLFQLYSTIWLISVASGAAPLLDLPEPGIGYKGSVREDSRIVDVSPEIRIKSGTGPVCDYKISSAGGKVEEIPFTAEISDEHSGTVRLVVGSNRSLDCEQIRRFQLLISAVECNGTLQSPSAPLTIDVQDVNEFAPEFTRQWYQVSVDEGKIYDHLIKLEATDKDCTAKYSEICRYEITNNATLFDIDASGVIRTIEPLNWTVASSHILTVVAHDCGMKASKEVIVTVDVLQVCQIGWKGFDKTVDFYPSMAAVPVAKNPQLDLCDLHCTVEFINATVTLDAQHISQGCDREADDIAEQQKKCGINRKTVELLEGTERIVSANETVDDETNKKLTSKAYEFDGESTAITVDPELIKPSQLEKSTISFWMRHEDMLKPNVEKGHLSKENILCSSDESKMKRHHFALFVRNCKLELLIRRESIAKKTNSFKPAEWRWKMAEVCDNKWHQYSISINNLSAELFIDGRRFADSDQNLEILDDFPMHSVKGMKTRLVIGACWQGLETRMDQHFKGFLAGLTVLPGALENAGALECLHRCKETLVFTGLDSLKAEEEASFSPDMLTLTLKSSSSADLSKLVGKVGYFNGRKEPTPGHRDITIESFLKCRHMDIVIPLPPLKSYVFVRKTPDPEVMVSTESALSADSTSLIAGVKLFSKLQVIVEKYHDGVSKVISKKHKLSACRVTFKPQLTEDENITVAGDLLGSLQMEKGLVGLTFKGMETSKYFETVLRELIYSHSMPVSYKTRRFTIGCSTDEDKVFSNVITVMLKINRDSNNTNKVVKGMGERDRNESAPGAQQPRQPHQEPHNSPSYRNNKKMGADSPLPLIHDSAYETFSSPGAPFEVGSAVAIVVVVCVGFLLLLLIVGVLRVRSTNRVGRSSGKPRRQSNAELLWDDSGMNIIVNPIEEAKEPHPQIEARVVENTDDSDSDCDDDESLQGELTEDDDGEVILPHVMSNRKATGLEWDDTTSLKNSATKSHKSQTYRV